MSSDETRNDDDDLYPFFKLSLEQQIHYTHAFLSSDRMHDHVRFGMDEFLDANNRKNIVSCVQSTVLAEFVQSVLMEQNGDAKRDRFERLLNTSLTPGFNAPYAQLRWLLVSLYDEDRLQNMLSVYHLLPNGPAQMVARLI